MNNALISQRTLYSSVEIHQGHRTNFQQDSFFRQVCLSERGQRKVTFTPFIS